MGGNDSVTRNEFGENATSCLDTENERVDIDEDNAGGEAREFESSRLLSLVSECSPSKT